jgi:hypothetical protein
MEYLRRARWYHTCITAYRNDLSVDFFTRNYLLAEKGR